MLLLEKLQETSKVSAVKRLIDSYELAVYQGQPNPENDSKVWEMYEDAVEECRVWLRSVLAAEVFEQQEDNMIEVSLLLPDRVLEVEMLTSDSAVQSELLVTPLGEMTYYTYQALLQISQNPVQMLYRYFGKLIRQLHEYTKERSHCGGNDILHKYTVDDEDIVDVLGIHRFDAVWGRIDEFFGSKCKEAK